MRAGTKAWRDKIVRKKSANFSVVETVQRPLSPCKSPFCTPSASEKEERLVSQHILSDGKAFGSFLSHSDEDRKLLLQRLP